MDYSAAFFQAVLPNLNAARDESVVFTRAYASGPKCAPSRTSLLTGRYPSRVQYTAAFTQASVGDGKDARWDGRSEVTVPSSKIAGGDNANNIAAVLQRSGYHTTHSGKWHVGTTTPFKSYNADEAEGKAAGFDHVGCNYAANIMAAGDAPGFSNNQEWCTAGAIDGWGCHSRVSH